MMEKEVKLYSHSKLWLFENCPEAFKIKYIDKKWPDVTKSVEAFLGGLVHESLEWLYKNIKFRNIELDDLVAHFARNWSEKVEKDLRTNGGKIEDYFNKGIKFLIFYYQTHKPFDSKVIDVEKEIFFNLDSKGEYKIRGFIDRIDLNEDGVYEVHDYKTNSFMKKQEEVDKDRQLAFYHLGLKSLFGDQIKVKLIWHFLAYDRAIVSFRTDQQLDKLKNDTLDLIRKIEVTKEWDACGRRFCDWCSWKKVNSLESWG